MVRQKDRLTRRTDALGQVQEWEYGKAGRLLHHFVKPAANTPGYQYDLHYDAPADDTPLTAPGAAHLLGQLAWVEHPFGTEHYAYDANGRPSEEVHTLWDPEKAAFETQREGQGRDTFRRKFAYRADGLPTKLESVGGFVLLSEYNERSGLRKLTAAVGGTSRDVLSNIEYDARGLDVKTDLGNQNRVCKAYDRRGQLTGLLAGRQDEITCGKARTISDPGDVGTDGLGHHHLQYARTHDGLIEKLTDLSARVGPSGNQSTPDGPPRLDASYTYDSLQQLTSATDADGTTVTYQYDLVQNLVGRFATDQKGERIAALGLPDGEFTYGENAGPNAITSAGCGKTKTPGTRCEAFDYDQAGQLKRYHGYDLSFDAEGRLVEAGNAAEGRRLQYFYDAWGERRLVLLYRRGKPVETHRFVFPEYQERDGERVWHAGGGGAATEIIESEGVKADLFLLGEIAAWKSGERTRPKPLPAEYEALSYEEALKGYETGKRVGGKKTVWRYVTTDHLGGATHVTDSAGDLVSWQGFEAYGKTRDRSGQAFLRGYIGTEVEPDLDLGLIRMGARWYAPELGRWVSPDPLIGQDPRLMAGRVLESGLYGYAANNPIMGKDPTGLACTGAGKDQSCQNADGTEMSSESLWDGATQVLPGTGSDAGSDWPGAGGGASAQRSHNTPNGLAPGVHGPPAFGGAPNASPGAASTLGALPASPGGGTMAELPASGVGYSGTAAHHNAGQHWAVQRLVDIVVEVGRRWEELHPGQPFVVGAMGARDGGPLPTLSGKSFHKSHSKGVDVDVSNVHADGSSGWHDTSVTDANYSRAHTQELLNLFRDVAGDDFVFALTADPDLQGTNRRTPQSDHTHHVHLRIRVPPESTGAGDGS